MSWAQAFGLAAVVMAAVVTFVGGIDWLGFHFPRTMRAVAAALATGLVLAGFAYIIKNWS